MITVVCVFNDQEVLKQRLLSSLSAQTVNHQLVLVDNRDSSFRNAASALNHGARQAEGEWIVFLHQDVSLISRDWLFKAEELLCHRQPVGWVGVAGVSDSGVQHCILRDSSMLRGFPFEGFVAVQTLDEVLLIHRRETDDHQYFDEAVPGWHAYGVEACCRAVDEGKNNYVIPMPIWHDSKRTNLEGLTEAHDYVWRKYGAALRRIYTTCGVLGGSGNDSSNTSVTLAQRLLRRTRAIALRTRGFHEAYLKWYEETLESFTENTEVIECLHQAAPHGPIEAGAFAALPRRDRRIIHRFCGLDVDRLESDFVVVAADLAATLHPSCEAIDKLRKNTRNLLVCLDIKDAKRNKSLWRALLKRSVSPRLTLHFDGSRIAVLPITCG